MFEAVLMLNTLGVLWQDVKHRKLEKNIIYIRSKQDGS